MVEMVKIKCFQTSHSILVIVAEKKQLLFPQNWSHNEHNVFLQLLALCP